MLTEILALDVYRFFMIFTRIAAALMLLPGFGGRILQARMRLMLALSIAFVLMPVIAPLYPPQPSTVSRLLLMILGEATVGLFLGVMTQVLMATLHIAGTFIGFQTGLTNAFSFDAVAEQQSQLLTSFFTNVALVIIFATDLHHLMLRALVDSYDLFRPGHPLPFNDFTATLARSLTTSFALGVKISAPLLVFGLVFYSGLGLLSRLVPQMQVFFVALPIQVIAGLWMMMISLPVMMFVFLRWFEDGLFPFLTPR